MKKFLNWILYVAIIVLFVVLVYILSSEGVTDKLAKFINQKYHLLLGIDYSILALSFIVFVVWSVYNLYRLYIRKDEFFKDDIVGKLFSNPSISKEDYRKKLAAYRKETGDRLSAILDDAAEECEGVGSFAGYYDATGVRIERYTEEAPKVLPFRTIQIIAPSAGFLGTLIGMVKVLKGKGGFALEDIQFVTEGLLVAIITSIAGLFILIVSAYSDHKFTSRAERIRNSMLELARQISDKVKGLF
jgi:biopolymer transport protein ExbB/TolQ